MKNIIHRYILGVVLPLLAFGCGEVTPLEHSHSDEGTWPMSDPQNLEGWVLNEDVSDEFDGTVLDTNKWFIQGLHGDYYIWKGRAPAQFVPHNVRVENGKLKLRTQWEPEYPFVDEEYAGAYYGRYENAPMPVTTAGVITKKRFLNGYMEVKSRAGDACITAAFWAIGYEQELDVYELMGRPKLEGNIRENWIKSTVHDWSPPAVRPTAAFGYTNKELPFRVAEEFHVYGAEWGRDYLNLFLDGELLYSITQDDVGLDWVLNNPMEVWLDSEIFRWLGMPDPDELPVDFEIEYLRVWQKPDSSVLDRAFFGFEGPILFEDNPRPLTLVPESSVPDEYQKFWIIDDSSAQYLGIAEGMYRHGVNALEFSGFGKNESFEVDRVWAEAPAGACMIDPGTYMFEVEVWMDQGRPVRKIHFSFGDAFPDIVFDTSDLPRKQWTKLRRRITFPTATGAEDQFRIEVRSDDVPVVKAARFYLDEISLIPVG